MHYLFVNLTMKYARFFRPKTRRLIEFFALLNALFMLVLLVYIHITFVKSDNGCLDDVGDMWPRNGILRVQVLKNTSLPKHRLYFTQEPFSPSSTILESQHKQVTIKHSLPFTLADLLSVWGKRGNGIALNTHDFTYYDRKQLAYWSFFMFENTSPVLSKKFLQTFRARLVKTLNSITFEMNPKTPRLEFDELNREFNQYEIMNGQINQDAADIRDYYAMEFSKEFAYLRMSLSARKRLSIPTLVVTLKADDDKCFGSSFKKFFLKTFLGYDDYIITSIKKLTQRTQNFGFIRNLVTNEHFQFERPWGAPISIVIAVVTMIMFTLVVTMLLRYAYHQIFIAMVEVVRLVDANTQRFFFPIGPGPLFVIILALVGMEEIMLEFFHDSSIAFYVIITIWIADQFDMVCMNSILSRRYWIRFFFLYHFTFYVYHKRYNGRFSKLALMTSWLFIQHSMIYFIHHYELPMIQRQVELFDPSQSPRPSNESRGSDEPGGGGDGDNGEGGTGGNGTASSNITDIIEVEVEIEVEWLNSDNNSATADAAAGNNNDSSPESEFSTPRSDPPDSTGDNDAAAIAANNLFLKLSPLRRLRLAFSTFLERLHTDVRSSSSHVGRTVEFMVRLLVVSLLFFFTRSLIRNNIINGRHFSTTEAAAAAAERSSVDFIL